MKELMDTGASLPLKAALAYEYTTSHAQIIRPSIGGLRVGHLKCVRYVLLYKPVNRHFYQRFVSSHQTI